MQTYPESRVNVSFLEIYNEQLEDLLVPPQIQLAAGWSAAAGAGGSGSGEEGPSATPPLALSPVSAASRPSTRGRTGSVDSAQGGASSSAPKRENGLLSRIAGGASTTGGGSGGPAARSETRLLTFEDARASIAADEATRGSVAGASGGSGGDSPSHRARPDRGTSSGSGSSGGLQLIDMPDAGTVCVGLSEVSVDSMEQVGWLLTRGDARSSYVATQMNKHSNRAHRLWTYAVAFRRGEAWMNATLTLVDLAGSEDVSRSGATGSAAKEASYINKSLLALGRVINALAANTAHIPYRESKLTRILAEALGGVCKTTLIATVSPSTANYSESLSTLRYASRAMEAMNIKALPKWQQDDVLIESLARRVQALEAEARTRDEAHTKETCAQSARIDALLSERTEVCAHLQRGRRYLQDMTSAQKRTATHLQTVSAQRDGLAAQLTAARGNNAVLTHQRDAVQSQRDSLVATLSRVRETRELLLAAHRQHGREAEAYATELTALLDRSFADSSLMTRDIDSRVATARANEAASGRYLEGVRSQLREAHESAQTFALEQTAGHAGLSGRLAELSGSLGSGKQALLDGLTETNAVYDHVLDGIASYVASAATSAATHAASGATGVVTRANAATQRLVALQDAVLAQQGRLCEAYSALEAGLGCKLTSVQERIDGWAHGLAQFASSVSSELGSLQLQVDQALQRQLGVLAAHSQTIQAASDGEQAHAESEGERLIRDVTDAVNALVRSHVDAAQSRAADMRGRLLHSCDSISADVRAAAGSRSASISDLCKDLGARTLQDVEQRTEATRHLQAVRKQLGGRTRDLARQSDEISASTATGADAIASVITGLQAAAEADGKRTTDALQGLMSGVSGQTSAGAERAHAVTGSIADGATSRVAQQSAVLQSARNEQAGLADNARGHAEQLYTRSARLGTAADTFVQRELNHDTAPAPPAAPLTPPPRPSALPAYAELVQSGTGGGPRAERLSQQWQREQSIADGREPVESFPPVADLASLPASPAPLPSAPTSTLDVDGGGSPSAPSVGSSVTSPSPADLAHLQRDIDVWFGGVAALASCASSTALVTDVSTAAMQKLRLRTADSRGSMGGGVLSPSGATPSGVCA